MENMRDLVCNNFIRLVDASPLTKRELAKIIGVNENTLQRWKNKDSYPELPNIEKLALALNVSPLEFYKSESKPVIKVSSLHRELSSMVVSVPDEVYELAAKLGADHEIWKYVIDDLQDAVERDRKEKSKKSQA